MSARPTNFDAAKARAEYDEATKNLQFTKDFNTALEALMNDPVETIAQRVLAWLKRRSWGNFRLFAANEDGSPAFQRDCAKDLKIKKQLVSKAVSYWEQRGYLACKGKVMYPVLSPVPPALRLPGEEIVKKSPEWVTFLQLWKVTHSVDFQALEDARSVVKRIRKVILSDYKKSLASETTAAAIKEESSESVERNPLSSSSVVSLPVPERKAEEEEERPYDQFKKLYPPDHFNEAEAKPSFEGLKPEDKRRCLERLNEYLACERWQSDEGRWIPLASNWLTKWDADPPPVIRKKAAKAASGSGSHEEWAAKMRKKYGSGGSDA